MKLNHNFDIMQVADEYIAIPLGDLATDYHGVIVLSKAAAYLLQEMRKDTGIEDLVIKLIREFDVDLATAHEDISSFVETATSLGLIDNTQ